MDTPIVPPSRENAAPPTAPDTPERPRWAAFGVILTTTLALIVTPAAVGAAVSPIPEGTVGVYERVTLQSESEAGTAIGGFIAPQGWTRADAPSATDAAGTSAISFRSPNGDATVAVSAEVLVGTSDELLRSAAPVGAALAPIVRLESSPLLTADLIEYDLEAGDSRSQLIAVCEVVTNAACLLFEVGVQNQPEGSDADQILPEVAEMVASTEVLPSAGAGS